MLKRVLLAATSLAYAEPALAIDLQSTDKPGRAVPSLTRGELAINRADGKLFYRDDSDVIRGVMLPELDQSGYLKLRNGMTLGRWQDGKTILTPDTLQILGRGSTGPAEDFTVRLNNPNASDRTMKERFEEIGVSILDFKNADGSPVRCDNQTDNTTGIMRAVDYAATLNKAATVWIPRGICVYSAQITIPDMKPITVAGHGTASVLRQVNPTANGIVFINTQYTAASSGVRDLALDSGAGYQTSNSFAPGSSGTGIIAQRQTLHFGLRNVEVTGFANGIRYYSVHNTENYNVRVNFFSGDGINIDGDPNDGSAGNSWIGGIVANVGFTGDNSQSVGVRIRSSGGEWFKSFDVVRACNALKVDPPAGKQVAYLWFHHFLADTSACDGIVIDGTAGSVVRLTFSDSWAAFGDMNGLITKGGNLHGVRATNMGLRENKMNGWVHSAIYAADVSLVNPDINSNSRGNPNQYSGVLIKNGVGGPKSFSILGGSIGNAESSSSDQAHGIEFEQFSTGFRIIGTDLSFYGPGKKPIFVSDLSNIGDYVISDNLPHEAGTNISNRFSVSAGAVTTAGNPIYLGPNGPLPFPLQIPWRANRKLAAVRLKAFASQAPGAGKNITVTLFKQGSATSTVATISGSQMAVSVPSSEIIDIDQGYEVQISPDIGGPNPIVNVVIELEPL